MRRAPVWPWVPAVVACLLAAAASGLNLLAGDHGDPWWVVAVAVGLMLGSVTVGLLVALRRPGHPIGALLLANAGILALAAVTDAYSQYAVLERPGALPGAHWAVLWDQSAWVLLFAAVTAIAFVFPDGRLPSRRWRPAAWGAAVAFAVVFLTSFGRPFEAPYAAVDNPLPELGGVVSWLGWGALLALIPSLLAAAWAVGSRFRSASGIELLQLKCLAFTACLIPLSLLAGLLTDDDRILLLTVFLMAAGIPGGVGLAVLRYRLFDIDRLINRALVYAVLTIALGAAYVATTLGLGVAVGGRSSWTTAAATLIVAAAFRPLRARVQLGVDRRFARDRYDALRRVEAFLADLRSGRAAPEEVEGVLAEALGDPGLELRYLLAAGEGDVDARGRAVVDEPGEVRSRTEVARAGVPIGSVLHAPALDERPDLLSSVIGAAGLAIEIARLRVELRRRLDEVQASRQRIVTAGDAGSSATSTTERSSAW